LEVGARSATDGLRSVQETCWKVEVFDNPAVTRFPYTPVTMDTYEQIANQLEVGSLAPEPAMLTGARIG
jgi:hypothetical protein